MRLERGRQRERRNEHKERIRSNGFGFRISLIFREAMWKAHSAASFQCLTFLMLHRYERERRSQLTMFACSRYTKQLSLSYATLLFRFGHLLHSPQQRNSTQANYKFSFCNIVKMHKTLHVTLSAERFT